MSSEEEDVAVLQARLARALAKKQRKDDEERARIASLPKELVPGTPSPRKKRRSDAADLASLSRPSQPNLFAKPVLARSFNPNGKVELRDAHRKESQFVDHMSALPKSLAEQMAEQKSVDRVKQERKKLQEDRRASLAKSAGGFGDLPNASKDILLSGRSGDIRLREKKPGAEAESSKGRRAVAAAPSTASSSSSRPAAPSAPAMSRPAPLPPAARVSSAPARPAAQQDDADELDILDGPARRTRRKDGTLIETVHIGPREFRAPADDPTWERVEPYSGIRLRERLLPHAQLDMMLEGRYHLTPSQIYTLARVDSRKRIDLDPEVIDSDFVVIGVLAWKDEVRFLNAGAMGKKAPGKEGDGSSGDDDEDGDEGEGAPTAKGGKGKSKGKAKDMEGDGERDALYRAPSKRQRRQRYQRFELVDLSSTATSGAADGRLSVMLVQADSEDKAIDDDGNEVSVYKGQSGGAFEKFWKETAGAVVAIINPSFLPHNKDFSYTLKPTSADSMVVLGRAENLAFCEAVKADGKRCGQWVDARMGKICQFHIERAVKRTGVRRAETNANTGSLSAKGTYNAAAFARSLGTPASSSSSRAQGFGSAAASGVAARKPLSPPPGIPRNAVVIAGSTTYVTAGARPSSSASTTTAGGRNSLPLGRPGGGFIPGLREGPSVSDEKRRRARQASDDQAARRELRALVGRDKGKTPGGEYLLLSRARGRGVRGSSEGIEDADTDGSGFGDEGDGGAGRPGKRDGGIFRAEALRRIGYNPTARPGETQRDESAEARKHRLALEEGLQDREMKLSAPRGARAHPPAVRAPGSAPVPAAGATVKGAVQNGGRGGDVVVDDDDDDLVVEGAPAERPKLVFPLLKKKEKRQD
ncbi:hypothetical protein JCM3770_005100 [Rhodotorula araucariae]